jgi:hypothetical protein
MVRNLGTHWTGESIEMHYIESFLVMPVTIQKKIMSMSYKRRKNQRSNSYRNNLKQQAELKRGSAEILKPIG